MIRKVLTGIWLPLTMFFALQSAMATAEINIRKVESKAGIQAWLVEDHDIPIVTMRIAFRGGSASDPAGKGGLASMVSGLLDEGAGDLKSEEFQQRLDDASIELSFGASQDDFSASLRTLSENKAEAFHLLGLALKAPRFDARPVKRVRGQLLSMIARSKEQPGHVASEAWYKLAFGDHPYGSVSSGTVDSVNAITIQDLKDFAARHFARDNLIVGVVGDISPDELADRLDVIFGTLPETAKVALPRDVTPSPEPGVHVIKTPSPQSVVYFGHKGIKRRDPDWYVAYVMNYILGGGGLTSRLADEVREKRGLAYSVSTGFATYDKAGLFVGNVGTQNERVKESIDVIRDEIARTRAEGVSAEELKNAITYLTGSYALSFSSSSAIAAQLVGIQLEGLGPEYVNQRNDFIRSVTAPQISRVAKRLLKPEDLSWVVVGNPAGFEDELPPASDAMAVPAE